MQFNKTKFKKKKTYPKPMHTKTPNKAVHEKKLGE